MLYIIRSSCFRPNLTLPLLHFALKSVEHVLLFTIIYIFPQSSNIHILEFYAFFQCQNIAFSQYSYTFPSQIFFESNFFESLIKFILKMSLFHRPLSLVCRFLESPLGIRALSTTSTVNRWHKDYTENRMLRRYGYKDTVPFV